MSPLQFHGEKEFKEWWKRMDRIKAKAKTKAAPPTLTRRHSDPKPGANAKSAKRSKW